MSSDALAHFPVVQGQTMDAALHIKSMFWVFQG
jgi:hypothetical protein